MSQFEIKFLMKNQSFKDWILFVAIMGKSHFTFIPTFDKLIKVKIRNVGEIRICVN